MRWKKFIIVSMILSILCSTTVTYADTDESAQELISTANSKLGCKYKWGTAGNKTFDCSGFVYWVYKQSDVKVKKSFKRTNCQLMYNSLKKYKVSSKVSKAKKGDIILYKNHGKYTHTAIATGKGNMIHASSSKHKVCKSKITACRHSSLAVIRILK